MGNALEADEAKMYCFTSFRLSFGQLEFLSRLVRFGFVETSRRLVDEQSDLLWCRGEEGRESSETESSKFDRLIDLQGRNGESAQTLEEGMKASTHGDLK